MTTHSKQPVDRARRFRIVAWIIGYCLAFSSGIVVWALHVGATGPSLELADLLVSSMMGLATATTMAYIGGSVVDYNGGVGEILSKKEDGK